MSENLPKYKYIDSLRGWAILGVLTVHTAVFYGHDLSPVIKILVNSGKYGVQLFFLVSAYTLFISMSVRKVERNKLTNFFIRRFFRIAPVFYCALIGYLLLDNWFVDLARGNQTTHSVSSVLATIFFVNSFNPYWINSVIGVNWSVAIEMIFYILVPSLFITINTLKKSVVAYIVVLILAVLLSWQMALFPLIKDTEVWNWFIYFCLPVQLPVFVLGIIWYFAAQNAGFIHINNKGYSLLFYGLFLLFFLLACFVRIPFILPHLIISISFLFLCIGVYLFPLKLLVNDITAFIGKISFSIYLVHWAIAQRLNAILKFDILHDKLNQQPLLFFIICFFTLTTSSIFISYFTYRFLETPAVLVGKRIINKLEKEV